MTKPVFQNRLDEMRRLMNDAGMGMLAINAGQTLKYLTGLDFHLSERPVVLIISQKNDPLIILPEFESGKVENASVKLSAFKYSENRESWPRIFQDALRSIKSPENQIGVEPTAFRYLEFSLLTDADPNVRFISAEKIIEEMRRNKDETEVLCIKRAIRIAENALEKTIPFIQTGTTEKEIANELVINLLRAGSDPNLPFSPIVASGPNSANPHAVPGDRVISDGDLVVIDFGARHAGYISDITRTFAIGSLHDDLREIYQVVRAANTAARNTYGKEITGMKIDRQAREVIQKAGFGKYFVHRTGHGIGLEPHESPYISEDNTNEIFPGMTFTIEPGIYIPGRGGVRIEDNMIARENHLETLTSFDRGLRIL